MPELSAIVLAAGLGKRMKSAVPKMLHVLAGRPLVYYPVRAAVEAGARKVVVVTSPDTRQPIASCLKGAFRDVAIECVVQDPPRGTGDAARVALEALGDPEEVMVFLGDTPLLRAADIASVRRNLGARRETQLVVLTCLLDDPSGYGRILRDGNGRVLEIREDRDLTNDGERSVREVNSGVFAANTSALREAVKALKDDNDQGELYLTDVVKTLAANGGVVGVKGHPDALLGVNDRAQLREAEGLLYERNAERVAREGATVRHGVRIDDTVTVEPDAIIESGVVLRGVTRVEAGATVDVGCVVTDSKILKNALLKPYTVVTGSVVGEWAQIGPFAHLRPESRIDEKARVGNFVETKKVRLRKGAKANHLAYLGDGDVGESANIGAGTIFCNYDGFRKHQTIIGDGAFVGSDSQLVAPVNIGKGAYVGTGTTVTKDVPDDALAIGRMKQSNKEGYAPRLRAKLQRDAEKAREKGS